MRFAVPEPTCHPVPGASRLHAYYSGRAALEESKGCLRRIEVGAGKAAGKVTSAIQPSAGGIALKHITVNLGLKVVIGFLIVVGVPIAFCLAAYLWGVDSREGFGETSPTGFGPLDDR
jgi:hypothetical protein